MEPASTVAVAESSRSYFLVSTLQNTKVPVVAAQLPLTRTTLSSEDDHVAALSEGEEGDRSDAVGMSSACMLDEASVVVGSFAVDGATYAIEPGGQEAALVSLDPRMLSDSLVDGTTLVIPSAVSVDASDPYAVARIADRAFVSLKEDIQVVSVISLPSSITVIDENAFTGADDIEAIEVEANNAVYASYDGCLYTSDLSCLLLIPGGRAGAVRISSQTRSIDPAASSHCAAIDSFVVEADRSNSLLGDVEIHDANGNSIMVGFADDASGSKRSADDTELDGREEDEGAVAASIEAIAPESSGVEQVPNVDSAFEMTPEENGDASIGEGPEADPGTSGVMLETATSFRSIVAPDPEPATTGALPCIYKDAAGASHEVTAAMVAAAEGNSAIAGWSFNPSSGSLKVWSQDGATVTNLWGSDSWNDGDVPSSVYDQNYWGPLRSQVVSIDTTELSGAVNMAAWFRNMTALDDISAVRIPNGSRGTGAEGIPNSLSRMFSHSTLRSIPSTFVIPEGVSVAHCAFALTPRLTSVYEGFSLPTSCLVAVGLFEGASAIESVPGSLLKNYADSDPVELNVLFNGCTSLASIRDGFSIPSSATNIELLFGGCSSLTYLPASLSLKAFGAKRAQLAFGLDHRSHDPYQFDPKVVTYYAGDDLGELLPDIKTELPNGLSASDVATPSEYWEKCYGRELITTGTTLELYVRDSETKEWPTIPWKTLYLPDNTLAAAPSIPSFWQTNFAGWCDSLTDEGALSGEFVAFPYTVEGEIVSGRRVAKLYAEYSAASGALPCRYRDATGVMRTITPEMIAKDEGDATIAGWSFDRTSGKLKIWSQSGATVTTLWGAGGDSPYDGDVSLDAARNGYWGPLRDLVLSIDTSELSGAERMSAWFSHMSRLIDIADLRIPDGSRGTGDDGVPCSLSRMLSRSGITSIPSSFVIPEGVISIHCAFAECGGLRSVYEGFSFPSSCTYATGAFERATRLEAVPGTLFDNISESSWINLNVLFNGCRSLSVLRDGFHIPNCAVDIEIMFGECSSLAYLPASLSLKEFGAVGASWAFGLDRRDYSDGSFRFDPPVVTYYAGDDPSTLLPDDRVLLPSGVSPSDVGDVVSYWRECYGRDLRMLGSDEVIVLTQKTGSGEVGWNQLEVVTVDADGKIDDPEVAVPFNYLFSWYADPLRKTPLEVVEGMIDVGGSSVIYGIFTPIISMDMPIPAGDASGRRNQIDLQIDRANGKVSVLGNEGKSAADIKVRSFAPVDTTLSVSSSQSLEQSGFAVELFGGNAYAVRVLLNMQGEEHRIALNHGSVNPIASLKGATSNTALEGDNIVDGTLTLDIGSGVTVAAMPEGEVGSKALTSLTWVVAAK